MIRGAGLLLILFGVGSVSPAQAQTVTRAIAVRVVDATDERAYVEPGAADGLRVGDELAFGGRRLKVVSVSSSFAAVALLGRPLAVGARGQVNIVTNRPEETVLTLAKPTPLSAFRSNRLRGVPPALTQQPTPVPLGTRTRSRNRLVFSDAFYALLPSQGRSKMLANELRGRLHYESMTRSPWALDADVAAQTFAGDDFSLRPGAASRQVLRVRELSLTYGTATDFRASLGRLRAASALVGQLDGVRLEAPLLPGVRVSAFGGTLPHAFNGMVSTRVARFGGELAFQAPAAPWQPRLMLGGHASHFDGALDERKVYASFDLLPEKARLGGHAEVSFFDANNPWHAHRIELTSATLDGNFEVDIFHFGGRVDFRRPERSRWLASLLPIEWLCWSDLARAGNDCRSNPQIVSWTADAGVRLGRYALDLGGHSSYTRGTDAATFGGFANLRWLGERLHWDAGMTAVSGSVMRSVALALIPGASIMQGNADLSVRYRPAVIRYRTDPRSRVEHSIGTALWVAPSQRFEAEILADWMQAADVTLLVAQVVGTWRIDP